MDDRDAMPYTAATIMETLRFGSVAPLGVPRAAMEDVNIGKIFRAVGRRIVR